MSDQKVLILGVGNILLTDEGFGVRAAAYLEEHYRWPDNVTLMDGGTQGLMLMSELMDCDFLVVLDVVLGPREPGTIYRLEGENLRQSLSFRDSMHQTDRWTPWRPANWRAIAPPLWSLAFSLSTTKVWT